jgi:D-tyrosyl-tRNA(Tyr) deacylase
MRAVVQRVSSARVTVEDETVGAIERGLLAYVGVGPEDGDADLEWLAAKLTTLRIFSDAAGRFDRSVVDVGGAILVVSQFTLYADTRRGRRPSFTGAAPPEVAEPLVERLVEGLRDDGIEVATGRFGAHMLVETANDGPVTITLDSAERQLPRRS